MGDLAEIRIISIEEVTQSRSECVIRCISGDARVGMKFDFPFSTGSEIELVRIEWYGKQVEVLDEGHSGKAVLAGNVEPLRANSALMSPPAH
ncbi:hypothetical protein ACFTWD_17215 [Streptomyces sp. NPDC056943]|uniref:hypothetical protein n=1 Tax=Streptomyces sp. NPDC056943 TaxID=3345971 RepID=UPI0036317F73